MLRKITCTIVILIGFGLSLPIIGEELTQDKLEQKIYDILDKHLFKVTDYPGNARPLKELKEMLLNEEYEGALEDFTRHLVEMVDELEQSKLLDKVDCFPSFIFKANLKILLDTMKTVPRKSRWIAYKKISTAFDKLVSLLDEENQENILNHSDGIIWFKVEALISMGKAEEAFNYLIPFCDKYKNSYAIMAVVEPEHLNLISEHQEFVPYLLKYIIEQGYWIPWEKQLKHASLNGIDYKIELTKKYPENWHDEIENDFPWLKDLPEIELEKAKYFPGSEVSIAELEKDSGNAQRETIINYIRLRINAWEKSLERLEYYMSFIRKLQSRSFIRLLGKIKEDIVKAANIITYLEAMWTRNESDLALLILSGESYKLKYEAPPFKYGSYHPAKFFKEAYNQKGYNSIAKKIKIILKGLEKNK